MIHLYIAIAICGFTILIYSALATTMFIKNTQKQWPKKIFYTIKYFFDNGVITIEQITVHDLPNKKKRLMIIKSIFSQENLAMLLIIVVLATLTQVIFVGIYEVVIEIFIPVAIVEKHIEVFLNFYNLAAIASILLSLTLFISVVSYFYHVRTEIEDYSNSFKLRNIIAYEYLD